MHTTVGLEVELKVVRSVYSRRVGATGNELILQLYAHVLSYNQTPNSDNKLLKVKVTDI